jgi:hypothetical protein
VCSPTNDVAPQIQPCCNPSTNSVRISLRLISWIPDFSCGIASHQSGCFSVNPGNYLPYPGIQCLDSTNGANLQVDITETETSRTLYFVSSILNQDQCNGLFMAFESLKGAAASVHAAAVSATTNPSSLNIYLSMQAIFPCPFSPRTSGWCWLTAYRRCRFAAVFWTKVFSKYGTDKSYSR